MPDDLVAALGKLSEALEAAEHARGQVVEAYDRQYWSVFRDVEREARERTGAARHILEAEMKQREQQDRSAPS
jgi:hypothetical protein